MTLAVTPAPEIVDVSSPKALQEIISDPEGVTVLNVWATWCLPCLGEMDDLRMLSKKFEARSVRFIGLSIDDVAATDGRAQRNRVAMLLRRKNIEYRNLYWVGSPDPLFRALRAEGEIPLTIVTVGDREVWRHQGVLNPDELAAVLDKALVD